MIAEITPKEAAERLRKLDPTLTEEGAHAICVDVEKRFGRNSKFIAIDAWCLYVEHKNIVDAAREKWGEAWAVDADFQEDLETETEAAERLFQERDERVMFLSETVVTRRA